jgi:hypothetical protein
MVRTIRSDALRPGDVLSTDGSTIESVILCRGGGIPDELAICRRFEDGGQKFDYVAPDHPVHVYLAGP